MQDGWPTIGIIDQPISGERWCGMTGQPTLLNGKPISTRTCAALDEAILATTGPQYFSGCEGEHFSILAGQCRDTVRSEEHTSELQSLMRISYAVFCLKKNNKTNTYTNK